MKNCLMMMLLSLLSCQVSKRNNPRTAPLPETNEQLDSTKEISIDPYDLVIKDLEVTPVSYGGNYFPVIAFSPSLFADYTEYRVCKEDGYCHEGKTRKSKSLINLILEGDSFRVFVRACIEKKKSAHPDRNCGVWLSEDSVVPSSQKGVENEGG